jgi:hypothetical protein
VRQTVGVEDHLNRREICVDKLLTHGNARVIHNQIDLRSPLSELGHCLQALLRLAKIKR